MTLKIDKEKRQRIQSDELWWKIYVSFINFLYYYKAKYKLIIVPQIKNELKYGSFFMVRNIFQFF